MATVNLYLKGALSNNNIKARQIEPEGKQLLADYYKTPLQIVIKVSSRGIRIQAYTGQRIEPIYWDKEKQEYNSKKYRKQAAEKNKWLRDLKNDVAELADNNERNGERITKDELRGIIEKKILNKPSSENLEEIFNKFLTQHKTPQGNPISRLTVKQYNVLLKHLTDFSKLSKINFDLSLFTKETMNKFKDYLYDYEDNSDNTIKRRVSCLKVFIKYLLNKNYIREFDLSQLKASSHDGAIYVIPYDILIKMQNANLKDRHLSRVRDVFLFQCWTGQRYSDIAKINRDEIVKDKNGNLIWDLVTVKGKERVRVPIFNHARQILNKYKNNIDPIPKYSEQEINRSIKEVGKSLNLNWEEKVIQYYRGTPKEKKVLFYEVLSTHVARKTFITNALTLGLPERIVREISKHKDERSFRRYVKLSEEFIHNKIREAFDKNPR